jgi:hypothetical protein
MVLLWYEAMVTTMEDNQLILHVGLVQRIFKRFRVLKRDRAIR